MQTKSFYTLYGKTGVGKTAVLRSLNKLGYPVLDLEALASHKGSIFGGKVKIQPTKMDFNSMCAKSFKNYNSEIPFFSEWKGKNIGKLKIPNEIISHMNNGYSIILERSIKERTLRLLEVYSKFNYKNLYSSLFLLKHRIRQEDFQSALKALDDRMPQAFINSILPYYDVRYDSHIEKLKNEKIHISCTGKSEHQIAISILEFIKQLT